MKTRPATLLALVLLVLSLAACSDDTSNAPCEGAECDALIEDTSHGDSTGTDTTDSDVLDPVDSTLCVGIRGNGELIFSHFAGLARIMEEYGLVDGAAGGSSGSISMFLLESVLSNPAVHQCGDVPCTEREAAVRAAFLMKSLQAYLLVLGETDEAKAFLFILPIIEKVRAEGLGDLAEIDIDAAKEALNDILSSEDFTDLVNDEVIDLLANSPDASWHADDLITALTSFGGFDATDPSIFIRPGVLDFGQLGRKIGRIANFYAAVGPADHDGIATLLDACAEQGRGMDWVDVAELSAGSETCGDMLVRLMSAYREALIPVEDTLDNRIDEPVGGVIPCLVSTSIIEGDAVTEFQAARANYMAAQDYTFAPSFDDIYFGYWGPAEELAMVESNPMGYDDLKTAKFRNLGQATWHEAISFSPAEPGLARALEVNDTQISAGGWSDLHPVLALQNMGCDQVIYLTRRGEESGFAQGVATLLGMSAQQQVELYDLEADSAFRRSLEEANGVWCTDWNNFAGTDVINISGDAYGAPFETTDAAFRQVSPAYSGITASIPAPGCTPGVGAE